MEEEKKVGGGFAGRLRERKDGTNGEVKEEREWTKAAETEQAAGPGEETRAAETEQAAGAGEQARAEEARKAAEEEAKRLEAERKRAEAIERVKKFLLENKDILILSGQLALVALVCAAGIRNDLMPEGCCGKKGKKKKKRK